MNSPGISFTNAAEAASMRADLRGMIRAGAVAVSCVVSTATAAAETARASSRGIVLVAAATARIINI